MSFFNHIGRYVRHLNLTVQEPEYPHNPVVFDTDENFVVYYFSAEQWRKIYSALQHGADELYADESHEVVAAFLWPVEFPVSICDLVAECIVNSIGSGNALEQAIQQWLETNGGNILPGVTDTSGTIAQANETIFNNTCNHDNMFGFCRQTVDHVHNVIVDVFEVLEAATSFFEFYSTLVADVPVLRISASFILFLQNSLAENYLANYTTELRDEYACDLYCLGLRNDCLLTWNDVTGYFVERAGKSLSSITLNQFLEFLASGSWSGTQFCDIGLAVITYALAIGANWANWSLSDMIEYLQSFANDPDSDWETICDDCQTPWKATFDFTQGVEGMVVGVAGTYEAGVGWHGSYYAPGDYHQKRIHVYLDLGEDVALVDQWACTISHYIGGTFDDLPPTGWAMAINAEFFDDYVEIQQMAEGEFTKLVDYTKNEIRIDGRSSNADFNQNLGEITISKLIIWGHGSVPTNILNSATTVEYL